MPHVYWTELDDRTRKEINTRIRRYTERDVEHSCLIWTASCMGRYEDTPRLGITRGQIRYDINIRRFVLEQKLGRELESGKVACHTCDNIHGPCVNVDHLYEGTSKQNSTDMVLRFRSSYGERNGSSKLNEFQVIEIYAATRKGITNAYLARKYSVSNQIVSNIKLKKSWKMLLDNIDRSLTGACS